LMQKAIRGFLTVNGKALTLVSCGKCIMIIQRTVTTDVLRKVINLQPCMQDF
jgi:riboflavin synthase alpha subunit